MNFENNPDILNKLVENQVGKRILYCSPIYIADCHLTGYLYLFDTNFSFVVHSGDFYTRHYSYKYQDIKSVGIRKTPAPEPKLLLDISATSDSDPILLPIKFRCEKEEIFAELNRFVLRFRMLTRLYKGVEMAKVNNGAKEKISNGVSHQGILSDSDDPLSATNSGSSQSRTCRTSYRIQTTNKQLVQSDDFDILSADNLKKLAGQSTVSKVAKPSSCNNMSGLSENTKCETKTATVSVPIELEAGGTKFILSAEANITLRLNIDVGQLVEAQKITNPEERLKKIRQLFKMEGTLCELNFT